MLISPQSSDHEGPPHFHSELHHQGRTHELLSAPPGQCRVWQDRREGAPGGLPVGYPQMTAECRPSE